MEELRLKGIFVFLLFILLMLFLVGYEYIDHYPSRNELVSAGAGVLIGTFICVYLNRLWDPLHLKPLHPEPTTIPWWIRYALPFSIILSTLLSVGTRILLGEAGTKIVAVGAITIVVTVSLYFFIQLWRYRPHK